MLQLLKILITTVVWQTLSHRHAKWLLQTTATGHSAQRVLSFKPQHFTQQRHNSGIAEMVIAYPSPKSQVSNLDNMRIGHTTICPFTKRLVSVCNCHLATLCTHQKFDTTAQVPHCKLTSCKTNRKNYPQCQTKQFTTNRSHNALVTTFCATAAKNQQQITHHTRISAGTRSVMLFHIWSSSGKPCGNDHQAIHTAQLEHPAIMQHTKCPFPLDATQKAQKHTTCVWGVK